MLVCVQSITNGCKQNWCQTCSCQPSNCTRTYYICIYLLDLVRTLEACRDAVVAAKQWKKSAKAALKAAQQTEDMETIGTAEEGLKLATSKEEESKQGVNQLEEVASLAEAAQTNIIQENEIKAAIPDKEMQEAINETIETEHINILTPDEKMGEGLDYDYEETREDLPAKKNVIKIRTLRTKKSKDSSKGRNNKEGKKISGSKHTRHSELVLKESKYSSKPSTPASASYKYVEFVIEGSLKITGEVHYAQLWSSVSDDVVYV